MLPLVGFFLLTFALLWVLRQVPGLGWMFGSPLLGFFLAAILVSYYGLQRRAWQQGGADK